MIDGMNSAPKVTHNSKATEPTAEEVGRVATVLPRDDGGKDVARRRVEID